MLLSNVLRSVIVGAGACDKWSTKEIAFSSTDRWSYESKPLVDNSLLIRLRASVAGCCAKSESDAFIEAVAVAQL